MTSGSGAVPRPAKPVHAVAARPPRGPRRGRTWLLAATLAALVASLVANLQLWHQATGLYREVNRLRLAPFEEASVPRAQLAPVTGDLPVWAFFGDSRAAQWPAPAVEGFEFRNLGISGQTSEQVAGRLASQLLPLAPRRVLLQVGINDLKTVALFPDRAAAIVGHTQQRISEIVGALRAAGSEVIVTTVFPVGALPLQRRPFWSPEVEASVATVNRHIESLARPGVLVFDAAAVLRGADGRVQPTYAHDFLHLSAAGYAALNQALARQLAQAPASAR